MRLSFFQDDFEQMLSAHAKRKVSGLQHNGDADSLFQSVLDDKLTVFINGSKSRPGLLESGLERDMCWYLISFKTENGTAVLETDNRMMFGIFTDQKNMIRLHDSISSAEDSFYGVEGDSKFRWERR